MKKEHMIKSTLKIAILSGIILGSFHVFTFFSNSQENIVVPIDENSDIYQSAYSANLWNVWIALSTRIGIQFQLWGNNNYTDSFYKEIANLGTTTEEKKKIRSSLIAQNMLIMREYLNLSKTDIKSLLNSSSNREATLTGFISQLEMRYKNSALSLSSLEKQKALILTELGKIETEISKTKLNMETHFSASNAQDTLNDVDEYFILRAQYTEAFTDIVFINQFIKQHVFLNNYNKGILDTLINNKEAIINQSYVVIPDSGDQYLRPLELIFDEAEIKAKR